MQERIFLDGESLYITNSLSEFKKKCDKNLIKLFAKKAIDSINYKVGRMRE